MTDHTRQIAVSSAPTAVRRFAVRFLLMALVWLALNGADGKSWMIGAPAVCAATWLSFKLLPRTTWSWSIRGAVTFAGFFLRQSLSGGWDVARRALSVNMALAPGLIRYPVRLPEGAARLFFCGAISLLPGTAVIAITEGQLCIHQLDTASDVEGELRELEDYVAALFGLALPQGKEVAP